jgi:hypothetical protein
MLWLAPTVELIEFAVTELWVIAPSHLDLSKTLLALRACESKAVARAASTGKPKARFHCACPKARAKAALGLSLTGHPRGMCADKNTPKNKSGRVFSAYRK